MTKLSLGISPCPNDTFVFDAMLRGAVQPRLDVDLVMEDVEALNQRAREASLDVTKISFHAWFHVLDEYVLLSSGSALGRGCGPLLVTKDPELTLADLPRMKVAIPGEWTTANLLLKLMGPQPAAVTPLVFDEVLPAIEAGEVDAGLVIHELRFTYAERGFHLLRDLGAWWEQATGCAIPLGAIIARRNLGAETHRRLAAAIRASAEAAAADPEAARPFMAAHAQDMDPEVMAAHVGLYVNDFTRDLGDEGEAAVRELHRRAVEAGVLPERDLPLVAR